MAISSPVLTPLGTTAISHVSLAICLRVLIKTSSQAPTGCINTRMHPVPPPTKAKLSSPSKHQCYWLCNFHQDSLRVLHLIRATSMPITSNTMPCQCTSTDCAFMILHAAAVHACGRLQGCAGRSLVKSSATLSKYPCASGPHLP